MFMLRFIIEFVAFFAALALFTLPLQRVASVAKRRFSQKKWIRGAAIVALVTAILGWSSRELQQECRAERNEGCVDPGAIGLQVVLIGGFALFALASAYMMYND
ncbi:MAG: protein-S-isoprenylcysteine O-methyltransferase Ste14 [Acidimicrobiales bacterium]|jgi:protein-S-isoprenylcysteine O-methyltransferase Ste14